MQLITVAAKRIFSFIPPALIGRAAIVEIHFSRKVWRAYELQPVHRARRLPKTLRISGGSEGDPSIRKSLYRFESNKGEALYNS